MARTAAGTVDGKVVAITGAARGIGFATARRLIADGAKVAVSDVDEIALKNAVGELGVTTYAVADVTDPESFGAFLDLVERELGPLDVVVNNAGIMPIGPFDRESDRASRRIVEINVLGVIFGSKLALQRMLPRRRGHVVNIASIAGESYVPGGATYCASKHAVKGLTESLRREYRGSGVDFSQVQPTFTNTELITGTSGTKGMRNAEPHEVADAVASLIVKPRPVVRVTRWAGMLAASQNVVPRKVGETVSRALGAEKAFTRIDSAARESYEDRVSSV
ncbi:SDR family oxidoreductase [Jatrophihabitans endophyticus]|uniref:SDR family oxidoreductase n=1 Tax=Jatrophihabitans endophyticus TaxID=1206085 RepID=UPI001A0E3552|nr:SDR family oxidoreductase [Jatrophihabitans endophyticus]MBE7189888.1 SDR family oxidoreductase [Jatrophihabitans endophyticus]